MRQYIPVSTFNAYYRNCSIKFSTQSNNPLLKKITKKYFAISAIPVSSERLFFETDNVLNEARNRLNGEHLEKIFSDSLSIEDWYFEYNILFLY